MTEWKRNCPNPNNNFKCKKEIIYKNEESLNGATKKGTVCVSCAAFGHKDTVETKFKKGSFTRNKTYEQIYGEKSYIEKEKRRIGNKNKIITLETKLKMSNSIKNRGGHSGKNNPMYGKIGANKDKKFSNDTKRKMRLAMIKQMQEKYRNNFSPNYSKKAIIYFNQIMKENNINIKHAENGGEHFIKELGYWLDGYDEENNIAYEFDELKHYDGDTLKQKDIDRQEEIEQFLKCKFIRIKSWKI